MKLITTSEQHKYRELYQSLINSLYPAKQQSSLLSRGIDPEHYIQSYFVMDGNIPLACATLYKNQFATYGQHLVGCIGNYECIEDDNTSSFLLQKIMEEASTRGMNYLLGPMNGSTWFNYRFRNDDAPKPFLTEAWNHFYYNNQFLAAGFKKSAGYFSALHRHPAIYSMEDIERKLEDKGIHFRYIQMDNYENELKKIYEFSIKAFANNHLYSTISYSIFAEKYFQIKDYLDADYIILAEDQGKLAGMVFGIKDLYNPECNRVVLKTVATLPQNRYRGLGMSLTNRLTAKALQKGGQSIIHAYMHESNQSTVMSKRYHADPYVYYSLYTKQV